MHSSAKLVLTVPGGQDREFSLAQTPLTLGRGAGSDIVLSDARASRSHARIEPTPQGWAVIDLGSANGTSVNGNRIERADLNPGDIIRIGDSVLRFEIGVAIARPGLIRIDTAADLEATLAGGALTMNSPSITGPRLAIHLAGRTWEIPFLGESLSIGRQADNDVVLEHGSVSRRHARIERKGDAFVLRDLQSTNGVWVRSERLTEHRLQNGDAIRIGGAQLVFKLPQAVADATIISGPSRSLTPRRPVVFVPGLMGSELWLGKEKVWPNVRRMLTDPDLFRLPDRAPLEPRGIVGELVIVPNLIEQEQYDRAGDFLEQELGYRRNVDLLEFSYDWRQDVRDSARRLAEAVDAWPAPPPITIIAHSLGCLVTRYYVERLNGKDKVERIILMGGPHRGAPKIVSQLLKGVELLPFGLMGERLREVIETFPSTYQILPTQPWVLDEGDRPIDLLNDLNWLSPAQAPLLHNAREFWQEMPAYSSVPAVSIFGYGMETITGARVQRDDAGRWTNVDFVQKPGGDVSVPEASANLEGSEIHPVQQNHGSLYVDNDVKMRLKLELTR